MRSTRALALPLCAVLLTACETLQPATGHLLPPPAPATGAETLRREVVLMMPVALPDYASEKRLAVLTPTGEVAQGAGDVWADALPRAATLRLAEALEARTGAAVIADPAPIEAAPTIRVEVVAARMIGPPGGPVAFSGEYRVSDIRRNGLAVFRRFDVEGVSDQAGLAGLAQAHADALERLADDMAEALFKRFAR